MTVKAVLRFRPQRVAGFLAASFLVLGADPSAQAEDRRHKKFSGQVVVTLPPQGGIEVGERRLAKYTAEAGWETQLAVSADGSPRALRVFLPSPFRRRSHGGVLRSKLPTRPQWYIYRFNFLEFSNEVQSLLPFQYLEVDWNTEGLPRGPNDSFITPHFDFHLYTKSREFINDETDCANNGKTCDSLETGQVQMGRFLDLPEPCFLPEYYFPDTGSSIPAMGLHNLDGEFQYTTDNVNHNAVIIYGSFDGEVAFLEASLTLFAFVDAMKAAAVGRWRSWEIRQPEAYMFEWWPTEIILQYLPRKDLFLFELYGFERHDPIEQCVP